MTNLYEIQAIINNIGHNIIQQETIQSSFVDKQDSDFIPAVTFDGTNYEAKGLLTSERVSFNSADKILFGTKIQINFSYDKLKDYKNISLKNVFVGNNVYEDKFGNINVNFVHIRDTNRYFTLTFNPSDITIAKAFSDSSNVFQIDIKEIE